jgi:hypothetical protein
MVTDLNKMEYLLNTKRCYCFLMKEDCKGGDNITKNYGAMDLRNHTLVGVLTYSLYLYRFRH